MAQQSQDSAIYDAVELLKDNGFDALAQAVSVLLNTAMMTVAAIDRLIHHGSIIELTGDSYRKQKRMERSTE